MGFCRSSALGAATLLNICKNKMGVKNENITTGKIEIYYIETSGPMYRKSRTIKNPINPKTGRERTKRLIDIGKTKWQELVNPT